METRWLVTGGAGYIGAHVVRALLASGRTVSVYDDLSTGDASRLPPEVDLLTGSVTDVARLTSFMRQISPAGVIHLAGKKSPADSVTDPLFYAQENVVGAIRLLEAVRRASVTRVVFSSSCSVYGTPNTERVPEDAPKTPESPYGDSKLYSERLLSAAGAAYGLGVISLRYFNVVGAAEPTLADSGTRNLVPQVFAAIRDGRVARIFGADYPTADGTCVRDYVDVEDVADAHVFAASALEHDPVSLLTTLAAVPAARSSRCSTPFGGSAVNPVKLRSTPADREIRRRSSDRLTSSPANSVGQRLEASTI